ncbi:hypothetical protein [Acinetobacter baumannii]|uniref:hypothetical protein n=1 Tax=Acinetobacter baumannii TaxID=470 RepID=UPI0023411041|nr:hypothetical protein [Acinetobacter baumannii]
MTLNERELFEAQHSDKVFKIVKFDETSNAYCLHDHLPLTEINLSALAEINYGWDLWQKAKAQAVPEGYVVVPKELPLEMALKIAEERILEQPAVKDPVLNEILEKAYKENLQNEQCRLIRDYKEVVKRLSESGAEG